MKRYFCALALLAVLAIPDWASACWPFWGHPVYPAPVYFPPPVYTAPIYPPVFVHPPVVYPIPGPPLSPPKVELNPKTAVPSTAPPSDPVPGKSSGTNNPTAPDKPIQSTGAGQTTNVGDSTTKSAIVPQKTETIRPAGINEATTLPIAPKKKDEPTRAGPDLLPSGPGSSPSLVLPSVTENRSIPKESIIEKSSKPVHTATPVPAPADPLQLLPPSASKSPAPMLTLPDSTVPAKPSAAPSSLDSLLPPTSLQIVPSTGKSDSLPSLALPPEVPISPAGKSESKSRSSPLTGKANGELTIDVFPVAALEKKAEGYRLVTFYNHTNRDLNLSIEGKAVKLPAKSYLETKLAPVFKWGHGDRPVGSECVPDGAAGLEVVFRE
jgi:hypothetical protein